jgi:pyruvate dehydrogenase E2 component (dihydrolipoamide acetyltransferase)
MTTSFRLPDLGEGVHEAEILAVAVTPGQAIREGELILEVETDKAAVEIPSPVTGTVEQIMVEVGDIARVGEVLITFTAAAAPSAEANTPSENTRTAPVAAPVGKSSPTGRRRPPVPASPSTRRLARELGVDLDLVNPTGTNGVVTAEDVHHFAKRSRKETTQVPVRDQEQQPATMPGPAPATAQTTAEPLPDFSQFGPVERLPFRSIRRATAHRMTASWSQIPHVNCQDMVDITRLEEFRQRHKKDIEAAGGRLTMTVFALKAVATALKSYPQFNASLDLPNQVIIIKKYFHIGVAVGTEHGLMVPVIRDVDRKSIKELAIELHQVLGRARERKSSREELIGGSFTITNAGAIGGSHFSAIINYPEIAILGMGQGRMQPAVMTDPDGNQSIVPRLLMPIVLCFDHRVADGADAIRFLQVIINGLQDPDELLITMI